MYALHELALHPDDLAESLKTEIQKELAKAIKVNTRPLTAPEWKILLEQEGFAVKKITTCPMRLLAPAQLIRDEGLLNVIKIGYHLLTHPQERHRLTQMRTVFKKYKRHISALLLICEK